MGRICLTYRREPEVDRWIPGDRWIRPLARRVLRGAPRPGGLDKVFINLRLGLDRLRIPYTANIPYARLQPDDMLGVLGVSRHCLRDYRRQEPFVAGIGLMTHPSEWPTLCEDYPVARYLQHSAWTDAVYRPYFGDRCAIWPVGIDTESWRPATPTRDKPVDFLIYDKIHWNRDNYAETLITPLLQLLNETRRTHTMLRYGAYEPGEYRSALNRCRAMIFLSAHESQGIAYQEAMSAGVPIFAWDPGCCQDPDRFKWGQPQIPTSSVPYFDARCGLRFQNFAEFAERLEQFVDSLHGEHFTPRDYILENLTLEKSARHFVSILNESLS